MSADRFCREWIANVDDVERAERASRRWQSCNVFYTGRTIYSYGTHFPMGYIVSAGVVWLNGDRYSSTTSQHQSTLRAACHGRAQVIIVPGSALSAAGVDYRTIEPVNIEPERFDYESHDDDTAPAGMRTDQPPRGYVSYGESWRNNDRTYSVDDAGRATTDNDTPAPEYMGWIESDRFAQAVVIDSAGRYRWHTVRHWLGDSVFTAESSTVWGNARPRSYWLSSFDRQESRPLYFLSQLPGPADTVDDAIESLAPDSVKTARDIGRTVVRQGDIFAIETTLTMRALRAAGARFTKRAVTVGWSDRAQQSVAMRDALQAVHETMPPFPRAIYAGGNVSDGAQRAFHDWHDERRREWNGELIRRYTVANPELPRVDDWQLSTALRYKPTSWDRSRDVTGEPLLGTAHTATMVATMPDGMQYARGCLYHEPEIIGERRQRDHARRPLPGNRWYLITRNTVPVSGPARRRPRWSA